jgi:hypothetical protein
MEAFPDDFRGGYLISMKDNLALNAFRSVVVDRVLTDVRTGKTHSAIPLEGLSDSARRRIARELCQRFSQVHAIDDDGRSMKIEMQDDAPLCYPGLLIKLT